MVPCKDGLATKVARAVYTSNLPFSWPNRPAVRALLGQFGGQGHLPSRRQLAGPLLKAEYEACWEAMKKTLCGEMVTVAVDSWTTRQNLALLGPARCRDAIPASA